jgi:integral membrane protein (TIGR01906 family)
MIGLSLLVFILVTIVQYYAFNEEFYLTEFEKYDIYSVIDLDEEGVLVAAQGIIEYLKGNAVDLELEYRGLEIFNNREIDHMKDVLGIFDILQKMKVFAGLLMILLLLTSKKMKTLVMGVIYSGVLSITLMGGLGLLMVTDFTSAFIRFHELIFSNELWYLDPRTDRLIQMLPEGFFVDMGIMIVISHLSIVITVMIIAIFNYKKVRTPKIYMR